MSARGRKGSLRAVLLSASALAAIGQSGLACAENALPTNTAGTAPGTSRDLPVGGDVVFGSAGIDASASGRLTVRGQTGFGTPLLRSEQISVTSPDLISGPPSGVLVGDSGLGGRLQTEAAINAGALRITPHGFGAMAWTWLEQSTPFERGETHIEAFGGGVSVQTLLGPFLVTGVLEYSHTNSNDRDLAGDWMTFQIALKF